MFFHKLHFRWREAEVDDKVEDENENVKSEDLQTNKNFQSTSLPPQPAQMSEPAPVRQTVIINHDNQSEYQIFFRLLTILHLLEWYPKTLTILMA